MYFYFVKATGYDEVAFEGGFYGVNFYLHTKIPPLFSKGIV